LRKRRKHTLIIVSKILTEPKAFLAGVILEVLYTSLKDSMAAFNAKMASSRPSGRWDAISMVERKVRLEGCDEGRGTRREMSVHFMPFNVPKREVASHVRKSRYL
jgi:hypothetical protein